jgi:hypothetical protein
LIFAAAFRGIFFCLFASSERRRSGEAHTMCIRFALTASILVDEGLLVSSNENCSNSVAVLSKRENKGFCWCELACKDLSSFGCRSIVPHQNQYQPSNGIFFSQQINTG